jgi:cardiolipin synthase A/B
VTRRAPPLEISSCYWFVGRPVHRFIRWTVRIPIFLTLLLGLLLTGCHVLPEVRFARSLPLSRSHATLDLRGPDGPLARAARVRLTRTLAGTGDTELLDYHLAAMQEVGAPSLVLGNAVKLLNDGPATYQAIFAAIENAQHYVLIESFIFEDAVAGDRHLGVLLAAAVKRGVRVLVLYDAVGSLSTPEEFLTGLDTAGVTRCAFNPLNPLDDRFDGVNQRDHRKIVVADGQVAFAGGVNFSLAYRMASDQLRKKRASRRRTLDEGWRDTHIEVRGPAASELEKRFRELWTAEKCPGERMPAAIPARDAAGKTLVQIVVGAPEDERNEIYLMLLSVLTYAQRSVDITMAYFVPDDMLEAALKDAARRGVRVRIILPSYSDFSGVFHAGRAHYDELLEAGVELYELESAFLHSKSIVVDGVWASVGSTNFDWRSFVHNHEISVCVIGRDFASQMEASFAHDLEDSRQITLEAWRKRGLSQRLRELFWLPLQYYL